MIMVLHNESFLVSLFLFDLVQFWNAICVVCNVIFPSLNRAFTESITGFKQNGLLSICIFEQMDQNAISKWEVETQQSNCY